MPIGSGKKWADIVTHQTQIDLDKPKPCFAVQAPVRRRSAALDPFMKYLHEYRTAGVIYCTTAVTSGFMAVPLGPITSPQRYIFTKTWLPQLSVSHC